MNAYVSEYRKIETRTRRRDNFLLRYLPILLLLLGAAVIGKIYTQSVSIRWSHRVIELKNDARDIELQNEDLTRAIAALTTRERVARDASERLGMIIPTKDDIVWLPVPHRATLASGTPRPADAAGSPGRAVQAWLDALLQEEALALTSQ